MSPRTTCDNCDLGTRNRSRELYRNRAPIPSYGSRSYPGIRGRELSLLEREKMEEYWRNKAERIRKEKLRCYRERETHGATPHFVWARGKPKCSC